MCLEKSMSKLVGLRGVNLNVESNQTVSICRAVYAIIKVLKSILIIQSLIYRHRNKMFVKVSKLHAWVIFYESKVAHRGGFLVT